MLGAAWRDDKMAMDSFRQCAARVATVSQRCFASLAAAGLALSLCLGTAGADSLRTERIQSAKDVCTVTVQGRFAMAAAPGANASLSTNTGLARTGYHANGNMPCAMGGQLAASCPFGVKRGGGGDAMLGITRPDGARRVIFFERGQAFGYDPGEADTGPFRATRRSDLTMLQIGRECYEIPDAVINGA
jgi:hypothetical protein